MMGKLKKAMYGTRDAPQIWSGTVKGKMVEVGFGASQLHPSVYWHREKGITIVVHVDDFLCIGSADALDWVYTTLKEHYDLKRNMLVPGSEKEVKYLNRVHRRGYMVLSGNVIQSMRGRCCVNLGWRIVKVRKHR